MINPEAGIMEIRKAEIKDQAAAAALYESAHEQEEAGIIHTGWRRGVYPTAETVKDALERDDLFVLCENDEVHGAAIINQIQPDAYQDGNWEYPADQSEVMVIHTLFISPASQHKGYGKAFIDFYERYAAEHGCRYLRLDTNAINASSRRFYAKLGYQERGSSKGVFNGIEGVELILLEKMNTK